MFETLGAPELLIIFALVVLLFGAGKVSRLGKDLGTSIREFRTAIRDDEPQVGGAQSPSHPSLPATSAEFASEATPEAVAGSGPPRVF